MAKREYEIFTESYERNAMVAADCSGILFINKGTNVVNINDIPLSQNETLNFDQDGDWKDPEIDRTIYEARFTAGVGTDLLYVVRKKYRGLNYKR